MYSSQQTEADTDHESMVTSLSSSKPTFADY